MREAFSRRSTGRRFGLASACAACSLVVLLIGFGQQVRTADPGTSLIVAAEVGAEPRNGSAHIAPGSARTKSLLNILSQPDIIPTHNHALVGRQAPDFDLADYRGKVWNFKQLRANRPVVLIFFYGSGCVHCVRHLSDINRDHHLFSELGAELVAISPDSPEQVRKWFQRSGSSDFAILSDPGNTAARVYQVFRGADDGEAAGIRHATFVIDRGGEVRWANLGDAPFRRNPALLYQLAKAEGRLPPARPPRP